MKKILILLLYLFYALASMAKVIYVDGSYTGIDTTGASWETPCKTIHHAVSIADSADELWITAGVYNTYQFGQANHWITLSNSVSFYGGFEGNEKSIYERKYIDSTFFSTKYSEGNYGTTFQLNFSEGILIFNGIAFNEINTCIQTPIGDFFGNAIILENVSFENVSVFANVKIDSLEIKVSNSQFVELNQFVARRNDYKNVEIRNSLFKDISQSIILTDLCNNVQILHSEFLNENISSTVVFNFDNCENVLLKGNSFTNTGYVSGQNSKYIVIDECIFKEFEPYVFTFYNSEFILVKECIFQNNNSGTLYSIGITSDTLLLTNCTFKNNQGQLLNITGGNYCEINGGSFEGNVCEDINTSLVLSNIDVSLDDVFVFENKFAKYFVENNSAVTNVNNSVFEKNSALNKDDPNKPGTIIRTRWAYIGNTQFVNNDVNYFLYDVNDGSFLNTLFKNNICTSLHYKPTRRSDFINCIISKNKCTDFLFGFLGELKGSVVYKNSYTLFNSGAQYGEFSNNIFLDNNQINVSSDDYTFHSCFADSILPGTNNLTGDPQFIDPANGDFRLRCTSPLINAGNNEYVETEFDYDGNPRIHAGTVDIGPFESMIDPEDAGMPVVNFAVSNISPCTSEEITFTSTGSQLESNTFIWNFGDGSALEYGTEVSYAFDQAGDYEVTLTSVNICGLLDSLTKTISVPATKRPSIFYPTTVSPDSTVMFYTDATCSVLNWSVEDGTIVQGPGTNTIYVQWDDGMDGNGSIRLDATGCDPSEFCELPVEKEIPIVPLVFDIVGENIVCFDSIRTYTISSQASAPGTMFSWQVEGGEIVGEHSGYNLREIQVQWQSSAVDGKIYLHIENELMNVQAVDSLDVFVRRVYAMPIDTMECTGTNRYYAGSGMSSGFTWSASGGVDSIQENGRVYWGTVAGDYTLYAFAPEDTSFCLVADSQLVHLYEVPAVDTLNGEVDVVLNQDYLYSVDLPDTSWNVTWSGFRTNIISSDTNAVQLRFTGSPSYVRARVDNNGCNTTYTLNTNTSFEFFIRGNDRYCINDNIEFSCNTSDNAWTNYQWYVNDELLSSGDTLFSTSFAEPGFYTISVSADFNGYTYNAEKSVTIIAADFYADLLGRKEIDPEGMGTYRYVLVTDGVQYTYNVEGGTVVSENADTIEVTWGGANPMSISIIADEAVDTCSPLPQSFTINKVAFLDTVLVASDTSVCVDNVVSYALQSDSYTNNISWQLSGGGTILSSNDSVVHIKWGSSAGTYTLTARYERFGMREISNEIIVHANPVPEILTDIICGEDRSTISSVQNWESYSWKNVQTGKVFSKNSIAFIYNEGSYELQVSDTNGCYGTTSKYVKYVPEPTPYISASKHASCIDTVDSLIHITYSVLESASAQKSWYLDDTLVDWASGSSFTVEANIANEDTAKVYAILQQDGCTAKTDELMHISSICEEDTTGGGGSGGDTSIVCNDTAISFTVGGFQPFLITNTSPVYDSFAWNLGDGTTLDIFEPEPHFYNKIGSYTISLERGCQKKYALVKISAQPLFSIKSAACAGQEISFVDYTEYDPNYPILGWEWNFGDGTEVKKQEGNVNRDTVHTFSEGTYTITLAVYIKNDEGVEVRNYLSKEIVVQSPPVAQFSVVDPECYDNLYAFINTSETWGGSLQNIWNFPDGEIRYTNNPLVRLPDGNQVVQLIVKDVNACTDTIEQTVLVNTVIPKANIVIGGSTRFCYGDSLLLTTPNGSNGIWLNNGDTLSQGTPSLYAKVSGNYTVLYQESACEVQSNSLSVEVMLDDIELIGDVKQCVGADFSLKISNIERHGHKLFWYKDAVLIDGEKDVLLNIESATLTDGGDYSAVVNELDLGCVRNLPALSVVVDDGIVQPIISASKNTMCHNDTITLTYTNPQAGISMRWLNADTLIGAESETIEIIGVATDALFTLQVEEIASGCIATSAPLPVDVMEEIVPNLADTVTACRSEEVYLYTDYNTSDYTFLWKKETDTLAIGAYNSYSVPFLQDTDLGEYTLQINGGTNFEHCVGYDTITVTMRASPPLFNIFGNTDFCEGSSTVLTSEISSNIVWNTSETTPRIVARTEGPFYVTAEEPSTGCQLVKSVYVTMNPLPDFSFIAFGGPFERCNTEEISPVGLRNFDKYRWYRNGVAEYEENEALMVYKDGAYTLELTSFEGCTDMSKEIFFNPKECYGECIVQNTNDALPIAPPYSLRYAINCANETAGPTEILFDLNGTGPFIFEPVDVLPTITEQILINGFNQSGDGIYDIVIRGTNVNIRRPILNIDETANNSIVEGILFESSVVNIVVDNFSANVKIINNRFENNGIGVYARGYNDNLLIKGNVFDSSPIKGYFDGDNMKIAKNTMGNAHFEFTYSMDVSFSNNALNNGSCFFSSFNTLSIENNSFEGSTKDKKAYLNFGYQDIVVIDSNAFGENTNGLVDGPLQFGNFRSDLFKITNNTFTHANGSYLNLSNVDSVAVVGNVFGDTTNGESRGTKGIEGIEHAYVANNTFHPVSQNAIVANGSTYIVGNAIYNSGDDAIVVQGIENRISKNHIQSDSVNSKAIELNGSGNVNKAIPQILLYLKNNASLVLSGTAEANDTVEVFVNNGTAQQAIAFAGSSIANESGEWTLAIPSGNTFNPATVNYYVATASAGNNTSELSEPFMVNCFECICSVTSTSDAGAGSLRDAIDRAHSGECLTIEFDVPVPSEIVLQSELRDIELPIAFKGNKGITISGAGLFYGLNIQHAGVSADSLAFADFDAGLRIVDSATLISNCSFINNDTAIVLQGDNNSILQICIDCNSPANDTLGGGIFVFGNENIIGADTARNAIHFGDFGVQIDGGTANQILYSSLLGDSLAIDLINNGNYNHPAPTLLVSDSIETGYVISGIAQAGDRVQLFTSDYYGSITSEFVSEVFVVTDLFSIAVPQEFIIADENTFFVLTATSTEGNTSPLSDMVQIGDFSQNCIVTNTDTQGKGSMRSAVECVNRSATKYSIPADIVFDLPAGVNTITVVDSSYYLRNPYGIIIDADNDSVVLIAGGGIDECFRIDTGALAIKKLAMQNFATAIVGEPDSLICKHNHFIDNDTAIFIQSVTHSFVDSNVVEMASNGFVFSNGSVTVRGNEFSNPNGLSVGQESALRINGADSISIQNNIFSNASYAGLFLHDTIQVCNIEGNEFSSVVEYPILSSARMYQSNISFNTIHGSSDETVVLSDANSYANLVANEITGGSVNAVSAQGGGVFQGNTITAQGKYGLQLHGSGRVVQNTFSNADSSGLYMHNASVIASQNIFENTPSGAKAIMHHASFAGQQLPASWGDYYFENNSIVLSGSAQANEKVEVFVNTGTNQEALSYAGKTSADASGYWQLSIPVGDNFNPNARNYYVNTATGIYTSELSSVLETACLECACMVTNNANDGAGSFRAAIDSANKGNCMKVRFSIEDTIAILSALPSLELPISVKGPVYIQTPLVTIAGSSVGLSVKGTHASVENLGFYNMDTALYIQGNGNYLYRNHIHSNNKKAGTVGILIDGNENTIGQDTASAQVGNYLYSYNTGVLVESGHFNTIVNNNMLEVESLIVHSNNGNDLYPIPNNLTSSWDASVSTISGKSIAGDRIQVFTTTEYGGEAGQLVVDTVVGSNAWTVTIPQSTMIQGRNNYFVLSATSSDGNTSEMSDLIRVGNFKPACYVYNTEHYGRGSLRAAVQCANETPEAVDVLFDLPNATNEIELVDSSFVLRNMYGVTVDGTGEVVSIINADTTTHAFSWQTMNTSVNNLIFSGFDTVFVISGDTAALQNNSLTENTLGAYIENSAGITLQGNQIDGAEGGFILKNVQGVASQNYFGVDPDLVFLGSAFYITDSSNMEIGNSRFTDLGNGTPAIYSENSKANIHANDFFNIDGNCITMYGQTNPLIVSDNTFLGNSIGLDLNDTVGSAIISNNYFSDSLTKGIVKQGILTMSSISANEFYASQLGIEAYGENQMVDVEQNIFERNTGTAMWFESLNYSTVFFNRIGHTDSLHTFAGYGIAIDSARQTHFEMNRICNTDSSAIYLPNSYNLTFVNNEIGYDSYGRMAGCGRHGFEIEGYADMRENKVFNAKGYGIFIADSSTLVDNMLVDCELGGIYVQNKAVKISESSIINNVTAVKAIDLHDEANENKAMPRIETYYRNDTALVLRGTSEPNDTVEVFRNINEPQQLQGFIGKTACDANGNWQLQISEGAYFNPTSMNFYVATATKSMNTSEVTDPFKVGCFDCICSVTNANNDGAGSLRAQIDSAHSGMCLHIAFDPSVSDTVFLTEALQEIQLPITISGTSDTSQISAQYNGNGFYIMSPGVALEALGLYDFETAITVVGDYAHITALKASYDSLPLFIAGDSSIIEGSCLNCGDGTIRQAIIIEGNGNTIGSSLSPNVIYNSDTAIVVNGGVSNTIAYNRVQETQQAISLQNNGNALYPSPSNLSGLQNETIGYISGTASAGDIIHVYASDYYGHDCNAFVAEYLAGSPNFTIPIPLEFLSETSNTFFVLTATSINGNTSELSAPVMVGNFEIECWVTNTNNAGEGSLRDAVECANNAGTESSNTARILFDLPDVQNEIVLQDTGLTLYNMYGVTIDGAGTNVLVSSADTLPYAFKWLGNNTTLTDVDFVNFDTVLYADGNKMGFESVSISNAQVGIAFDMVIEGRIMNTIMSNIEKGIVVNQGSDIHLEKNTIGNIETTTLSDAISFGLCNESYIENNTIVEAERGIIIRDSLRKSIIANNIIFGRSDSSSSIAIAVPNAYGLTCDTNTVSLFDTAVALRSVSRCDMHGGTYADIAHVGVDVQYSDSVYISQTTVDGLHDNGKPIHMHNGEASESNHGQAIPEIEYTTYKNGKLVLKGTAIPDSHVELFLSDSAGRDLDQFIASTKSDQFGLFTFHYDVELNKVNNMYFKVTNSSIPWYSSKAYWTSEASAVFKPNIKTCYVTSNSDADVVGTLRYNINLANKGECNLMLFDVDRSEALFQPQSALPEITALNLTIDATSYWYFQGGEHIILQHGTDDSCGISVNTEGIFALHGMELQDYIRPILIKRTDQAEVSRSVLSNFTDNAIEIDSDIHYEILLDSNSYIASNIPVALTIDKPHVEVRNSFFNAGDTALVLHGDTCVVYKNTFGHTGSAGKVAIALKNADTVSVMHNTIDDYETAILSNGITNSLIKGNAINDSTKLQTAEGIRSVNGNRNYIVNNKVSLADIALAVELSSDEHIVGNELSEILNGIYVTNSDSIVVLQNNIWSVDTAIVLSESEHTEVNQNMMYNLWKAGVFIGKGCEKTKIIKNKIGVKFVNDSRISQGHGVVCESDSCIIGGSEGNANYIINNILGGIQVSGISNAITYNVFLNNDTTAHKPLHYAIHLADSGNEQKSAPNIDSAKTVVANKHFYLYGSADPSDSVHVYLSGGYYQNTKEFVAVAKADSAGKWQCSIDSTQFETPNSYTTKTLVATATDTVNNTSQLSDIFYLGTCYVTNNKDFGNNEFPYPNSLRQAFVCANGQNEKAEIRIAVPNVSEVNVKVVKPLVDLYNAEGVTFIGENMDENYKSNILLTYSTAQERATHYIGIADSAGAIELSNVDCSVIDTAIVVRSDSNFIYQKSVLTSINAVGIHFDKAFENVLLSELDFNTSYSASLINNQQKLSNIAIQNSSFSKVFSGFILNDIDSLSITDNEFTVCDTAFMVHRAKDAYFYKNSIKISNRDLGALLDNVDGLYTENEHSSSYFVNHLEILGDSALIVQNNTFNTQCDVCLYGHNVDSAQILDNEFEKAQRASIQLENAQNIAVMRNKISSVDTLGIELLSSEHVLISRNEIVDLKYDKTHTDTAMAICINRNKADVSNNNKPDPIIDSIQVKGAGRACEDDSSKRTILVLNGRAEPLDIIEIFFSDEKTVSLEQFVVEGVADSNGLWAIDIPREHYLKDLDEKYSFTVTATDTVKNTSQTAVAFRESEIYYDLIVANTADTGANTLRNAIRSMNCSDVRNRVLFHIDGTGPHEITLNDSLSMIDAYLGFELDGITQFEFAKGDSVFGNEEDSLAMLAQQQVIVRSSNFPADTALLKIDTTCYKSTVSNLLFKNVPKVMKLYNSGNTISSCIITGESTRENDTAIIFMKSSGNTISKTTISNYELAVAFDSTSSSNTITKSMFDNVNRAITIRDSATDIVIRESEFYFDSVGVYIENVDGFNSVLQNTFGSPDHPISSYAVWIHNAKRQFILENVMPYAEADDDTSKAFILLTGNSDFATISENKIGISADISFTDFSNMKGIWFCTDSLGVFEGATITQNEIVGTQGSFIVADSLAASTISNNYLGIDMEYVLKGNNDTYNAVPGTGTSGIELTNGIQNVINNNIIINYLENGINLQNSREIQMTKNVAFSEYTSNQGINLHLEDLFVSNDSVIAPTIDTAIIVNSTTIHLQGTTLYSNATVQIFEAFDKDMQAKRFLSEIQANADGTWAIDLPTENFGFTDYNKYVAQVTSSSNSSEYSTIYRMAPLLCKLVESGLDLFDNSYAPCPNSNFTLDPELDGLHYRWTSANNAFEPITTRYAQINESGEVIFYVHDDFNCEFTERFTINYKDIPRQPDFLIASENYVGDTIVLIDVLEEPIKDYEWTVSDGVTIISEGEVTSAENSSVQTSRELRFLVMEEGNYTIEQTSYLNGCFLKFSKDISIEEKDPSIPDPYELTPDVYSMFVYPSPATKSQEVSVYVEAVNTKSFEVQLVSPTGDVVYSTILGDKKKYILNIPAGKIQTCGVYIVVMKTQSKTISYKFLVAGEDVVEE